MSDDIQTRVLTKMLDRLFASMLNGPGLNCRPHSSRQRIDFASFSRFRDDLNPTEALLALLSEKRSVRLSAKVNAAKRRADEEDLTPEQRQQVQDYTAQQTLVKKLGIIADDARTYEMDTGVYVLNLGFPLLGLPANSLGGGTRRILAPIAFVAVTLEVNRGATDSVTIACRSDGQDLVTPNNALLTWLEAQTNHEPTELFADDAGEDPWREIAHLVKRVAEMLSLHVPEMLQFAEPPPAKEGDAAAGSSSFRPPPSFALSSAPRSDDPSESPTIIPAAVLGLFPANNQSLLRDTQAMLGGETLTGPIQSFLTPSLALDAPRPTPEEAGADESIAKGKRAFADERLVAQCDPCQARAVKLARDSRGLVMHGPPGTGKSQTITNIIGDHLSRGQRVLLVCDKRTALDVVANRLAHMGLSSLCALVHDPQRDQRELYKSIREQIEALAETETDARAEGKLAKLDAELQDLHDELSRYYASLMDAKDGSDSFHNMVGRWLALRDATTVPVDDPALQSVALADVDAHEHALRELLERGQAIGYATNPWVEAAGVPLAEFLSWPMAEFRNTIQRCVREAHEADATLRPGVPPFADSVDLAAQAKARVELADELESLMKETEPALRQAFARKDPTSLNMADRRLTESAKLIESFRATPLDGELAAAARSQPPQLFQVNQQIAALDAYLEIAGKWYGFIYFKRKSDASAALKPYGLPLSADAAQRLRTFLLGLRDRLHLQAIHNELNAAPATSLLADDALATSLAHLRRLTTLLHRLSVDPALQSLRRQVVDVLPTAGDAGLIEGLRQSPPRARALVELDEALTAAKLFDPQWLASFNAAQRQHRPAAPAIDELSGRIETLENALRIRQSLPALPAPARDAALVLLRASAGPDESLNTLRRSALTAEIAQRLRSDPHLQSMDGQRLKSAFDRYRKLDAQKRDLVRDTVLHRWVTKQKERLLAATGGRLNSVGADAKRRLTLRGERAMRLRQVVALGATQDGGDPLFDLRPIWMASPETVAQVFPRRPVFDVVVFDEASQCRLEEALPVLTRGGRVVIAGDPKQLPPTRFFESTVAVADGEEDVETDQDLFELQQGEVEDLLAAALNLEIDQCYLDVHYRSKNADLIEFSNRHFYNARLQPIPQHPARRGTVPPIRLVRVDGLYKDRCNEAEADAVVALVKELLSQKKPPSIGIACFNVTQRDVILDKLDEAAGEDEAFASRLEAARARVGQGSFEGLFVKNLENVQGDERDHMIISTTYGPDEKGRFYRRFGPLGRTGGGRRLNVLVTRAREQVHLITSIPADAYQALPPVPQGQSPAGPWLLFAYLHYAHELAKSYAPASEPAHLPDPQSPGVDRHPTRTPSPFADALASHLHARHAIPADVHWGNEGFCVDVALRSPSDPAIPSIGVLADAPRFKQADDPVEWDLFRTAIHESQGWTLHRVWTPHFFRDPEGSIAQVVRAAGGVA